MKIRKTLGAGVMSIGLVLGMAGFAGATSGTGTIDNTGPHSRNVIRNSVSQRVNVDNDTDISARIMNHQEAWSGNAVVRGNTTGGDATSGEATNSNSLDASVSVDNTGSVAAAVAPLGTGGSGGSASITDTGPHSNNQITSTSNTNVSVDNDTDISVDNYSSQTAASGNAVVRGNTTGGDATSGDASNTNSTSLTFTVNN